MIATVSANKLAPSMIPAIRTKEGAAGVVPPVGAEKISTRMILTINSQERSEGVIVTIHSKKFRGHSHLLLHAHEHPVVLPHVSHFMHVPFRTSVKLPHSPHISPS